MVMELLPPPGLLLFLNDRKGTLRSPITELLGIITMLLRSDGGRVEDRKDRETDSPRVL